MPDENSRQEFGNWFDFAYKELLRVASAVKRDDVNATISTSTIVHEVWMKLAKSPSLAFDSEPHLRSTVARAMRHVVRDAARRRCTDKRGGEVSFITLDDSVDVPASSFHDIQRLDTALEALAKMSPRQSEMIELRCFGGFTVRDRQQVGGR